jgi:tetratricopeptide (TPR) repeat protein
LAENPPSPEDDEGLQAEWHYLSGISAWHLVPPSTQWMATGTAHLESLVQQFPDSVLAAQGAYTLGRILEVRDFAEDVVDLEAAKRWYERCIAEWPEYVSAVMARFRLAALDMNAYEDPERMARGVAALDGWLQANRSHELAPVAAVFLADHLDSVMNDPGSALPYYLLAEELGWVSKTLIGHRRWRMAEIAESLDQVDLAVEMYQKIIRENLQSARGYESQLKLKALQERYPERSIVIPPLLPIIIEDEV